MMNDTHARTRGPWLARAWMMTLLPALAMALVACGRAASAESIASGSQVARSDANSASAAREIELAQAPTVVLPTAMPTPRPTAVATTTAEVEFTGVVEAIGGAIWTIGGRTVASTPQTEVEGQIKVGDQVKVHALAAADGTLTAREIELSAAPSTGADQTGDDSAEGGRDDDQVGDDDAVEDGQNQAGDSQREIEFTGQVEAISGSSWTIGGRAVAIAATTEIEGAISTGDAVEVDALAAADGTLTAREIELTNIANVDDDQSNDGANDDQEDDD